MLREFLVYAGIISLILTLNTVIYQRYIMDLEPTAQLGFLFFSTFIIFMIQFLIRKIIFRRRGGNKIEP